MDAVASLFFIRRNVPLVLSTRRLFPLRAPAGFKGIRFLFEIGSEPRQVFTKVNGLGPKVVAVHAEREQRGM